MAIRIIVTDDHGLLRAGMRTLLDQQTDFEVVGEAENGAQAVELVKRLQPDVVLMDISMPDMDGLEAMKKILANDPNARVLLVTVHEDTGLMREAIHIGAAGYILKRAVESELIDAIHAVLKGEIYIHPAMTRGLLEQANQPVENSTRAETLTVREVEVLKLVAEGYTNRHIAELLHISIRTVETHRANLMAKLGISSRVELVRYATQRGMITAH